MFRTGPGRNDHCPCGSGCKFKHCCLPRYAAADTARLHLRAAEGRVIDALLPFVVQRWGKSLLLHAWEDFWNYDDVPEDMAATPEFGSMFLPWFGLRFVPDPSADEFDDSWPRRPIGLEWLETGDADVSDLDRKFVEAACRSPMSVLVVERATPGRSLDLRDVLTGSRFHVLEQGASQTLRPADLIFARVITIDGASIMVGLAPFVVPPSSHTHIKYDGDKRPAGYIRPDHLLSQTAVHLKLSFNDGLKVPGPLAIGAGRHCGFGLMAGIDC
jgi:hypothetical protein